MEVATKLALFAAGVVVAVVAGWALGQAAAVVFPDYIVPGQAVVHQDHALPLAGAVAPEEIA